MTKQGSLRHKRFYSDISATIAENFEVPATENGQSFLKSITIIRGGKHMTTLTNHLNETKLEFLKEKGCNKQTSV